MGHEWDGHISRPPAVLPRQNEGRDEVNIGNFNTKTGDVIGIFVLDKSHSVLEKERFYLHNILKRVQEAHLKIHGGILV